MPKWLIEKLIALNLLPKPAEGTEPTEEQVKTAVNSLTVNPAPAEVPVGDKKISVIVAGDNRETFLSEVTTLATNAATATTNATKASDEAKKFRGFAINALLDSGKITAAQKTDLESLDGAAFETKIGEFKKTALNTKQLDPLQKNGADISTPAGRTLAFNARVNSIMAEAEAKGRKISIDDAITQMRANADDAALLKAMEPAPASN